MTIRISPGKYFAELLKIWLMRWWGFLAVPVMALLAASVVLGDERWAIVALAVVFFMWPWVMSMVYINYMLDPVARRAMHPRHVTVTPGKSISIHYLPAGKWNQKTPEDETIPWSQVLNTFQRKDCTVYLLRGKRMPLVITD